MAAHVSFHSISFRSLPGHDFNSSWSAGVNSQWVCFFSHGRADETIIKCELCNRTGLPAHTQDLKGCHIKAWFISVSVKFIFLHRELVWVQHTWLCVVNPVSAVLHVSRILVLVTWPLTALYSTVHLPDTSFCSQTLSLFTLTTCNKILKTWRNMMGVLSCHLPL